MTIQIKDKIHFINNNNKGTLDILNGSEKLLNLRDYSLYTTERLITYCSHYLLLSLLIAIEVT